MTQQQIDIYMMSIKDKFTTAHLMHIQQYLATFNEAQFRKLSFLSFKDPIISLIISIFLGHLGIDRFFIGDTGLGLLKLLTCGGCGIWTIFDWCTIMERTKEKNFELFMNNAF